MARRTAGTENFADTLADDRARQRFCRALLRWFSVHARTLPWRPSPGLYETGISEIMLQQTQVATVIPYYTKFLARFPDVRTLAAAKEQDLLRCWEGLGYYRRARQLQAAARCIVEEHAGHLPTDYATWRNLPGIGRYTAGAILSIALDQRLPILEANTVRLFARLLALHADPTSRASQDRLWALAESLVPERRAGDFNQALMELGSTVCTPRGPGCPTCPVAEHCATQAHGWQDRIPYPKRKTTYTAVREAAVVVQSARGELLLRRCAADERWAGMWDFPRFTIDADGPITDHVLLSHVHTLTGAKADRPEPLATLTYGVTRFRITLECFQATCRRRGRTHDDLKWVTLSELESYPLSVTGRKIGRLLTDRHASRSP
jgi:A/G-specific adenine glycosylase